MKETGEISSPPPHRRAMPRVRRRRSSGTSPASQGTSGLDYLDGSIRGHNDRDGARTPVTRVPVPAVPVAMMPVTVMPVRVMVAIAIIVAVVTPVPLSVSILAEW
jgi:hypothetical protein